MFFFTYFHYITVHPNNINKEVFLSHVRTARNTMSVQVICTKLNRNNNDKYILIFNYLIVKQSICYFIFQLKHLNLYTF